MSFVLSGQTLIRPSVKNPLPLPLVFVLFSQVESWLSWSWLAVVTCHVRWDQGGLSDPARNKSSFNILSKVSNP